MVGRATTSAPERARGVAVLIAVLVVGAAFIVGVFVGWMLNENERERDFAGGH